MVFSTGENQLEIWLNFLLLERLVLKILPISNQSFPSVKFYVLACLWTEKSRGGLNLACRTYLNAWHIWPSVLLDLSFLVVQYDILLDILSLFEAQFLFSLHCCSVGELIHFGSAVLHKKS